MNMIANIVISNTTTLLGNMEEGVKNARNAYIDLFAFKSNPEQSKSGTDNTQFWTTITYRLSTLAIRFKI